MSLFLAVIDVASCTPRRDGVIRGVEVALLAQAEKQAEAILARARQDAAKHLQACELQTQQTLQQAASQAHADARALNEQLQSQWDQALTLVQACALAIARLAFERVGAQFDLQQRIEAAVATALRELPSPPVRLWLPETAPEPALPESARRGQPPVIGRDSTLAGTAVAVEDGAVTIVNDFETARAAISNELMSWLKSLLGEHMPPSPNRAATPLAQP
jgi:vacuolar-type H+-ATPase subunit E/Vma4